MKMMNKVAKIIALEGLDGVGKSTYANKVVKRLSKIGIKCILAQELPSPDSFIRESQDEQIMHLLKIQKSNKNMGYFFRKEIMKPELSGEKQLIIISAARIWHTKNILIPALESGVNVIMDRYIHSTYAYQGLKVEDFMITFCKEHIWASPEPDFVIFLDGAQIKRPTDDNLDNVYREKKEAILMKYRACLDNQKYAQLKVDFDTTKTEEHIYQLMISIFN